MAAQGGPDLIRLWTIQSLPAWQKAQRVGALKGDGRFVWKEFRPAYRWMRRQMAERLGDCRGQYPVWAWLQPKPDLRRGGHLPQGMIGVRLEFIVPAQEVLLSDFSAWHMVLNDGYLALSEAESDAFYERHFACCETTPRPAAPRPLRCAKEVEKSWERIFGIESLANNTYWQGAMSTQGVLRELPLERIVRVDSFVSR